MANFFNSRNNLSKILIACGLIVVILWLSGDNASVSILKKFQAKLTQQEIRLPQLNYRRDLATLMESMGGKKMVEIGVHRGDFAVELIKRWPSIQKYYGVDPWTTQENYLSALNMNNKSHQKHYLKAIENLEPFGSKVELIRGFSTEVIDRFPDASLDLVYVDGRHDYCGCLEDLEAYWPKLKGGGIMAGHDYMDAVIKNEKGIDWTLCKDGTKHEGAVIAAVADFMKKYDLHDLKLIYETGTHPSFYFLKPPNA